MKPSSLDDSQTLSENHSQKFRGKHYFWLSFPASSAWRHPEWTRALAWKCSDLRARLTSKNLSQIHSNGYHPWSRAWTEIIKFEFETADRFGPDLSRLPGQLPISVRDNASCVKAGAHISAQQVARTHIHRLSEVLRHECQSWHAPYHCKYHKQLMFPNSAQDLWKAFSFNTPKYCCPVSWYSPFFQLCPRPVMACIVSFRWSIQLHVFRGITRCYSKYFFSIRICLARQALIACVRTGLTTLYTIMGIPTRSATTETH